MKKRTLSMETLSARQLMAIDIAEIEPNNLASQATPFQLSAAESVVLRGNSSSQNDKDYFAFTASKSGPVAVAVNSSAGAKLEVTSRAGAQLFENEPKNGVNNGVFQTVAGTTYLLRMRAPSKSPAEYAVTLTSEVATANPSLPTNPAGGSTAATGGATGGSTSLGGRVAEAEPNDSVSQAPQLSLVEGDSRTLTGAASKTDRDYFLVSPISSGTVSLDTGTSNVKVSVETRQGVKLFESEPNDGVTRGTFAIAAGQSFVVRTRGLQAASTNYSIDMSLNLPVAASGAAASALASPTAARSVPVQWLDASDDGFVSAIDALMIINHLSHKTNSAHDSTALQFDMNDDSRVSPVDALLVINHLTRRGRGADDLRAEGESASDLQSTRDSMGVSFESELVWNRLKRK